MEEAATIEVGGRKMLTAWLMIATLMQATDATVANVALPYMQGALSASYDQITWVLTSYVIFAAIFTAPIGWLAGRFGRKNVYIVCLVGFTFTSMLCGIAGSLTQIVIYRALQGAFAAALGPLAQTTLMDIYPPKRRGVAMSIWGMGVMIGPILGPTVGGYLTAFYSWRYVFFINLPLGVGAIIGLMLLMPNDKVSRPPRFDWLGFTLISVGLAALQFALDKGEELDWLNSGTIVVCLVLAGLGFYLFTVHQLTARQPFFPRVLFRDRNLNAGMVTMFSVGLVTLTTATLMAPFLETLGNYPVATAGLLMAPRGIGTMAGMLVVGRLADRMDPRLLLLAGYVLLAISLSMQTHWTPAEPVRAMMGTIMLQGAALGFIFIPVQLVAFATIETELRTQASVMIALVRNVGSAIGVAISSAMLVREGQVEHAVLSQYVTPFSRTLQGGGALSLMVAPATRAGANTLDGLINTQAQIIAYIDDYWLLLLTVIPSMACLLLMRRPPTHGGAVTAIAD